jgi:hypothetical protein
LDSSTTGRRCSAGTACSAAETAVMTARGGRAPGRRPRAPVAAECRSHPGVADT